MSGEARSQSPDLSGTDDLEVTTDSTDFKKHKLLLYPSFGAGLIRNTLAPTFLINAGIRKRNIYEVNVNTNSIFFFERDADRNFEIYRNTFLNAEFLLNFSFFNSGIVKNWNGLGFGYLIESKGQYFKESTFVLYYRKKLRHFSITPGIIFRDDFKDAFQVIPIRL
jgi:hypothetical protein